MFSLLITLLEMKYCRGEEYANQVICNARSFAQALHTNNVFVAARDQGFTKTHQIWAYPNSVNCREYFDLLTKSNIITTCFDSFPGLEQPALRLSVSELTRLGANESDFEVIANLMGQLVLNQTNSHKIMQDVSHIAKRFNSPQYCFSREDVQSLLHEGKISKLSRAIFDYFE
jgi:glycine hydroxymethyltransferase